MISFCSITSSYNRSRSTDGRSSENSQALIEENPGIIFYSRQVSNIKLSPLHHYVWRRTIYYNTQKNSFVFFLLLSRRRNVKTNQKIKFYRFEVHLISPMSMRVAGECRAVEREACEIRVTFLSVIRFPIAGEDWNNKNGFRLANTPTCLPTFAVKTSIAPYLSDMVVWR